MKPNARFKIQRGDLYIINLGPQQNGTDLWRPVVVIQNDIGNLFCDTIIVAPLAAAKLVKQLFFSVRISRSKGTGLSSDHVALLSQIRTVPKHRFAPENFLGSLDTETMARVDQAIQLSLGLSTLQELQDRNRSRRKAK